MWWGRKNSALLVDFENVVRPPDNSLVARLANWVDWLERGEFDADRRRRRFLAKRVYWNSHCEGNRPIFERQGFDAFACPAAVKDKKSAADIWIALDAIDLTTEFRQLEEIIIISTDTDFIPVVNRLREKKKEVAVVVNEDNLSSDVYPLHADTVIPLRDLRAATTYERQRRLWFAKPRSAASAPQPPPAPVDIAPTAKASEPPRRRRSRNADSPKFDLANAAALVAQAAQAQPGLFISRETVRNVLRPVAGFSTTGRYPWLGCGSYCSMLKTLASLRQDLEVRVYADGGCAIRILV